MFDLIILGAGASGLSAAIYAGRYKLKTLVISREFGGSTAIAWTIWNYPGVPEVDGFELMDRMRKQAKSFGTECTNIEIISIKKQGHCFCLVDSTGKEYISKAVILSMGTHRRTLGLPNEKELIGKGLHYCLTCDSPLYANKIIAVVGGGDASVKGIILAGQYAKKIYLITRESELKAEPINLEQMQRLGQKVEVVYNATVSKINPKISRAGLESVELSTAGKFGTINIDGLFVEIGAEPNSKLALEIGVELDEKGYIKVDNRMCTNVDGVFAAGDITNFFGSFKQDITAAAQGAVAATSVFNDLKEHGSVVCQWHAK